MQYCPTLHFAHVMHTCLLLLLPLLLLLLLCCIAGMICPHIVNWSMLLGAILSWGLMW
jgi:hypothetical protein